MRNRLGKLPILALLAGAVCASRATAQDGTPPDRGQAAGARAATESASVPPPSEAPEPLLIPPPPVPPPPGKYLIAPDDPQLVQAGLQPGWFVDLNLGFVKPHLKAGLEAGRALLPGPGGGIAGQTVSGPGGGMAAQAVPGQGGPMAAPLALPTSPLDWTVLPDLVVGYRLGRGAGALLADYSFLNTAGSQAVPDFDPAGPAVLRTRLAVNRFDLSYRTSEYLYHPPPGLLRSQWGGLGIGAADVFFDSQVRGPSMFERGSSNFAGVGPTLMFGFTKAFDGFPVAVYGQTTMTYYLGKVRQHFAQTQPGDGGAINSASFSIKPESDGVGVFSAEAGLTYVPDWFTPRLFFSAGYHWERWWFVGNTDASTAELTIQGLFLRSEFRF